MGCGQSKINLYPRRNKNGGKGNSAKKSGAVDKEADEEEGSAGSSSHPEETEDDPERGNQTLPLVPHPNPVEVSASQEDFFKMLDEKIEKGKDYDSSSESEVRLEKERRLALIGVWRSASLSTQSSVCQSSPPTPVRKRGPRPPERHSSPGSARRCYRQPHIPEGMSPPPRRPHSAQPHEPHHTNGDWGREEPRSPAKRPQSSGSNWKNGPKVVAYNQKQKNNETNDYQRTQIDHESKANSNHDVSQITFNPTFQNHSPAHSAKSQQPYIAQIITCPMSQQVTPPSPPTFIAPPEEYQDPQNHNQNNKTTNARTPQTPSPQPNIYYIHGNMTATMTPDIVQQRQQTAFHLQQYVAMKQAQQQMFTYLQRGPHTVFPNVDCVQRDNRVYETEYAQYAHAMSRPHSAPTPPGAVRAMVPGVSPDATHVAQLPAWGPMPAVLAGMNPWAGQVSQDGPYYPQAPYIQNMYRPNSAGSAGTLTRYPKERQPVEDNQSKNLCQSVNLVRQKPVGQILVGGPELTVCTNANDSPSPASVSTDSGVSPGSGAGRGPPGKEPLVVAVDVVNNKKNKQNHSRPLKSSKSLDSS